MLPLRVSVLVFLAVSCPAWAAEHTLTILHTNDMHASFVPHEAIWVKSTPRPKVAGFKELQYVVDSLRALRQNSVLLDAGDVMTGNPICDRVYKGASGGALFDMMNMIGYNAWCPGNHDLDISQANLVALTKVARFPTLCANVVNDRGEFPLNNIPYTIVQRGGVKIGLIGIMSQELYGLVLQSNLKGLRVLSPGETLQKYADALDEKTDLIVAMTHQGFSEDSALAATIRGVDVIVGGHSHTRLRTPKLVNNVIIVQAGSNVENLGVLDLTIENDRVTRFEGRLIQLWADTNRPPTPLARLVDSLQGDIDREYSEVIGTLTADWVRSNSQQSAIGAFITEAQREAVRADIAFMNVHGIRKDLSAGPITKKDIFEILPFRNVLATFQLSGKQIQNILKYYLTDKPGILFAGLDVVWTKNTQGAVTIKSVRVHGKDIDESRMYICTASDYLVGEAQRYLGIELQQVTYLRRTLTETIEQAVRAQKTITPGVKYRFTQTSD